ncbi:MAG TPA: 50S ribosomal protein L11 methyltransferase [Gemmatimonadaceae bacterium]|nr:50S ribosomal protein L11 methyltransferase [Gemmatimonadaceae bacterium]
MTAGDWSSVIVRNASHRDAVTTTLFELGAEGVQESGDDLVTHLRDADRARVTSALRAADPDAVVEFAPTPNVDWSKEWRTRITAHEVGSLVVAPPWLATGRQGEIVIDPAMAFGTGEHETTRGMLHLMQRVVRAGDVVADLGAGSAVLSIAAAKLGALRCVAIELDHDAIANAESNVRANGVDDRVSVVEGDAFTLLPLVAPVRVVLANIVSSVLVDLLPVIRKSLAAQGLAILSGILVEERDVMLNAFDLAHWHVIESEEDGPWWSVTIAPA